ncbi:hypothetical protein ABTN27_21100, partial [Acinetobacter baumannii]
RATGHQGRAADHGVGGWSGDDPSGRHQASGGAGKRGPRRKRGSGAVGHPPCEAGGTPRSGSVALTTREDVARTPQCAGPSP